MARYKYTFNGVQVDSQRELWTKFLSRVCQPNKHHFAPWDKDEVGRRIDRCPECGTKRLYL